MQLQTGIVKDGIDFLTLDKVEIKEFGKKNHSLKGRCKQKNINNKNCQFMYDSLFQNAIFELLQLNMLIFHRV